MTPPGRDRPPRIVLVVHDFPKASETFIVQKFLGLLSRGADVWVFAARVHPTAWRHFPDLESHAEARRRVRGWPAEGGPALWGAALGQLARTGLRHPAPVLRCVRAELAAFGLEGLGRALFALPVVELRPDLVHLEFGTAAVHRMDLGTAAGAPVTASFRGYDLNVYGLDDPETYAPVWAVLAGAHFLGEDLLARARTRGFTRGIPTALIAPAVDTTRLRPADPTDGDSGGGDDGGDEPVRILGIGRLHWKKGYEFALHALRRLADDGVAFEYRILGDGPFEDAVRACVEDLELGDAVTLVGLVDHAQVRKELRRADVLLHAAVSEGFCNAVLEAQAMAVPVVCTDADGLPENVDDGVTGRVVPRRDPYAMADALADLVRDAPLRRRMGEAGRRRAAEHFTPEGQIDRFLSFFEEVLGRPVLPSGAGRGVAAPSDPAR